jgi:nucleotide-binding universal stress UspA family protein
MKSIVVPVDFSTCSANAARYAADLALAIKADLHLIHVILVPVTAAELNMTESVYRDFHVSQSRRLAQNSPIPVLSLHA